MGKRDVRRVPVPKGVSLALLIVLSGMIAALVYFLAGKAYAGESYASALLPGRSTTSHRRLAILMPLLADVLLFLPWGFLSFVALDSPSRPRRKSYVTTIASASLFAASMHLWQLALPSRVTSGIDLAASVAGALAGAALGQLRKDVRLEFEC